MVFLFILLRVVEPKLKVWAHPLREFYISVFGNLHLSG